MKKYEKKPLQSKEEAVSTAEVFAVYDQLDQLREEYPDIAAQVNPNYTKKTMMERFLGLYISIRERFHKENIVNRKVYLWLHLLGVLGIHHFYSRHWIKGLLYVAMSWTGVSVGMTFIDWMAAFPKAPDENGRIVV